MSAKVDRPRKRKKVLVTGLFEPAALHVIRRFGQMGYEVHVAEGHLLAYAGFSKYVKRRIRLPNMRYFPERYACLLYTSPSPRDLSTSRMPSSA